MTDRLRKNLDELAANAGVTKVTPEIRMFAWLVTQDALQGFWEAAQHYAKFEQEKVDRYMAARDAK
jgi:hypothetical protein